MPRDLKNELTYTSMMNVASRATNNVASTGLDLRQYSGSGCVRVAVGVQTTGDNAATLTVLAQSAANNTASEATNISGASFTTDGNNNASQGSTILIDKRSCYRYLFTRLVITGANSPAWPVGVEFVGTKQVQP